MSEEKNENVNIDDRAGEAIQNIMENYSQIERSFVEQLNMKQDLHGGTIGTMREDIWSELFQMLIPKKFVIEHSVFIIDSQGEVSNEVDLVIMDETYTPYIFRYGRVKFIPIEAVAVVVECKSSNAGDTGKWAGNIKKLRAAQGAISRTISSISLGLSAPFQSSTRPIRILCAMDKQARGNENFDAVIYAPRYEKPNQSKQSRDMCLEICWNSSCKSLWEWYCVLNHNGVPEENLQNIMYIPKPNGEKVDKVKESKKALEDKFLDDYIVKKDGKNTTLLSFNMQLNQLLMLINNPMFFPHKKYVDMFNGERKNK